MLDWIVYPFQIITDIAGDLSLAFIISIMLLNLYILWWRIPRRYSVLRESTPSRIQLDRLIIGLTLIIISFGVFFVEGVSVWLRIFSGLSFLLAFISIGGALYQLWHKSQSPVSVD